MLHNLANQLPLCLEETREAEQCATTANPETKRGFEEVAERWWYLASVVARLAPSTAAHKRPPLRTVP